MGGPPEITQRDLQTRSEVIVDALEAGQAFSVTRNGRQIGVLIPRRRQRRFVPRAEFSKASHDHPAVDDVAFRADQNAAADHDAAP